MNQTASARQKPLLRVLGGEVTMRPPIWIMRQAGRYLPEYREVRKTAGGFLELCYNPELAAEVTLQPIKRYGFDAAILFADILLIPQALGQKLWFVQGEGPRLEPITDTTTLKPAAEVHDVLSPVYETVRLVKASLPSEVALIGFAGAPWTVATYMIAGRGTPDQAPAHTLMKADPEAFGRIIDRIVEATILYLSAQIEAGAEVVKLFDSWAGSLQGEDFERASVQPCRQIIEAVRDLHPTIPIIGFPRGADIRAKRFVEATEVEAIAIEQGMDRSWARTNLQHLAAVQGNLNPALLVEGGDKMLKEAEEIIEDFSGGRHIFNLGHGVTPDASPDHVESLVRFVKG